MEEKRNTFRFSRKTKIFTAAALAVLVAFTGAVVKTQGRILKGLRLSSITAGGTSFGVLPAVQSYSNLEKLLEKFYPKNMKDGSFRGGMAGEMMSAAGGVQKSTAAAADMAVANGASYSTTNVQVQGVDEGDTVKTDGEYIYKIFQNSGSQGSESGVQIIKAYPGESMQVVQQIKLQDAYPSQIFLKGNQLVVIGSSMRKLNQPQASSSTSSKGIAVDMMYMPMNNTAAFVYDIKDRSNPKLLREMEIDGSFATARMIGSNVYVIANKYIYPVWYMEGDHRKDILPVYRDSAAGKDYKTLELSDIRYCPEALEPNFIMVASFNLDKINEALNVSSTLGSGHNIFCSTENLYIAGYNYNNQDSVNKSTIYKFNLKNGKITFTASGEVPGSILNQFSMDEHNGYFRLTTTSHPVNGNWNNDSVNNIYVLDKDMKLAGKVEGLAKGERIYSTRFIGDRAYMVTFKNTDPLYVIDMKNPSAPRILGELKIPGFSNYLHPYDENHIIGFGKDAEVVDMGGREVALQQGVKLAIFDVSDVSNPKQKFMEVIGHRGTDSELLHNHKALLFSKEKNLLAFPITVAEIKNDPKNPDPKAALWGMPTFVGAYVYNIDLQKGFTLKGKISHTTINENDYKRYFDWNGTIQRVLYIKDNLYTISGNMIKANKLTDLKETGTLKLR